MLLTALAERTYGKSTTSPRSAPPWRAQLPGTGQSGQIKRCVGGGGREQVVRGFRNIFVCGAAGSDKSALALTRAAIYPLKTTTLGSLVQAHTKYVRQH